MKTLIVDDELFARQNIKSILSLEFPEIGIVSEADSVVGAVEAINTISPELVFLDIELLDGTGFDVLNQISEINFKIIFVTAHHEHAIKAIKFSALDYILKPISSIELVAAVKRLLNERVGPVKEHYQSFLNHINKGDSNKKIVLKTSDTIHLVEIKDIIRCEANNNYTSFFIQRGEKIMVSKGLKEYDELLKEYGFLRVHQSHLINMNRIAKFEKKDGGYVVLSDESRIPVSQRRKQTLLEYFESLK